MNIGGGSGGAGRSGKKRRRDADGDEDDSDNDEVWEEIDAKDKDADADGSEKDGENVVDAVSRKNVRKHSKARRTEVLGKRRVDKEVYKKGLERKRMKGAGGAQWSR